MHISTFQIQNFKSLADVTLHFNENVNLFTGVNNSGKTSVLEAIALWQECYGLLLKKTDTNEIARNAKGQFILNTVKPLQKPFTEILSIRNPKYFDIFYNLDRNAVVLLAATLTNGDKVLEIGFTISAIQGSTNYSINLHDFSDFDFQLFNNLDFITNSQNSITRIMTIPVGTVSGREEIMRPAVVRRRVEERNSREVMHNRILDLENRFPDDYSKFLGRLNTILIDNTNGVTLNANKREDIWIDVDFVQPRQIAMNLALMGSGTLQIIEILLAIYEQKNELNLVLLDEPDSHIHRQLQKRLLDALQKIDNTQVFITTHNEALIRDAEPNWIFHLEPVPQKIYYPIERSRIGNAKGLLSSANAPIIQALSGYGNGLDFINALESDVLIMVEGVNDALRLQKLLSLRRNTKKYAFWVMGSVDEIFDKIIHYKNVFEQIRNEKTLWEKTVLVFDKDYMTDRQREKLMTIFQKKLNLNKIHIWSSYHFESVLFSDLDALSTLIARFIQTIHPNIEFEKQSVDEEMHKLVTTMQARCKEDNIIDFENTIKRQLLPRRKKLEDMGMQNVIESDINFNKTIDKYLRDACNIDDIHKIMDKNDCETVLKNIFARYDITFKMEGLEATANFNGLFASVTSSINYADWNFISKL